MEVLREIRVKTSDEGCYVKDDSSFHVNLNGLTLNHDERDKIFVRLENLTLPERQKSVKFFLYVGGDKKFLSKEEIQHFEVKYYSMNDLCNQLNCLVYNNFVYKTVCAEYKSTSVEVEPTTESVGDSGENSSGNNGADGTSRGATAGGSTAADDAGPGAAAAEVVVNGPRVDIDRSKNNVNSSSLLMNYDLRQQMSGVKGKYVEKEIFHLCYEENRVKLRIADGIMFFANCALFLALGFSNEVSRSFKDKSREDVLSESDTLSLKICQSFSLSEKVQFLCEKERICHIEFKKLVEPTFHVSGNMYSILSSYDFEKKKVICNTKRLSCCRRIEELNFCLYDNEFSRFKVGCCSKKFPISFDLIIFKKI